MIRELSTHNYYITPSPLHKLNICKILGEREHPKDWWLDDKNNVEHDSIVTPEQLHLQRRGAHSFSFL